MRYCEGPNKWNGQRALVFSKEGFLGREVYKKGHPFAAKGLNFLLGGRGYSKENQKGLLCVTGGSHSHES